MNKVTSKVETRASIIDGSEIEVKFEEVNKDYLVQLMTRGQKLLIAMVPELKKSEEEKNEEN